MNYYVVAVLLALTLQTALLAHGIVALARRENVAGIFLAIAGWMLGTYLAVLVGQKWLVGEITNGAMQLGGIMHTMAVAYELDRPAYVASLIEYVLLFLAAFAVAGVVLSFVVPAAVVVIDGLVNRWFPHQNIQPVETPSEPSMVNAEAIIV